MNADSPEIARAEVDESADEVIPEAVFDDSRLRGEPPHGAGEKWRAIAFGVLPAMALALAALAGFLKWQEVAHHAAELAATESVTAARETTTAILSYNADTAQEDLNKARDRLAGSFLDEYTKLINEVVIPGAKEKEISAVAEVPAGASVSATPTHATALVFVNQSVMIGKDAPTSTASSVRVTLDKVDGRWLVSGFEPV